MAPIVHTPPINAYIPIGCFTLAASTLSVTFGGIPAADVNGNALKDLVLVVDGKLTSTLENTYISFNGDTAAANYPYYLLLGTGSSAIGATYTARSWGELDTNPGSIIFNIFDYSVTNKHKSVYFRVTRPGGAALIESGRWTNTSAITSVTISGGLSQGFATGTTFSLYALAG